jgi:iron complex outermembrane receptor protein
LQDFNKTVWSEEVRLSSSGDSALKWLIGAFAQGINTYTVQQQILQPLLFDIPDAYSHSQTSYAVFGNATYDLDRWSFEGGLRLAYYDNQMQDKTDALNIPPTLFGSLTTDPVCAPCTGTVKKVEVMPMASVSYHVSPDIMTYLTIARGFEPADLNDEPVPNASVSTLGCIIFGCQTDDVHAFNPEYVLSYELGVKSTLLDNRLRLNADVFYLDYTNRLFEVGTFVGTQITTFEKNLGSSHSYGLELDAKYVPIDDLALSAGLGLTRAFFDKASDNILGVVYDLKGNEAPFAPAYQATLAVDWHHPLTDNVAVGARVSARLFGRSWWDGLDRFQQRPYQVVDAGLWFDIGEHWTLAAHVKNLFDERYNTFYVDQSESGAPFNEASIGAPRQAFASVTVRY